jgi:hypothetical protein
VAATIDWDAVGTVLSNLLALLALALAFVSYKTSTRTLRRAELKAFLQDSAYGADLVKRHLDAVLDDPDAAVSDLNQAFTQQLLPLRERAAAWPREQVPHSFDELVAAVDAALRAAKVAQDAESERACRTDAGLVDDDVINRFVESSESFGSARTIAWNSAVQYAEAARAALADL